jgi:hypothetical protein
MESSAMPATYTSRPEDQEPGTITPETENETSTTVACKAWRALLPVVSAAEIIPAYDDAKLMSLGRDIKQSGGCKIPIIVLLQPNGTFGLLDGRSRLDSMCHVGIKFEIKVIDGHLVIDAPGYAIPAPTEIVPDESFNPVAFVLSCNLHRRQLKSEQKREIIKKVILTQPDLNDRAIGRLAGADGKTVRRLRLELKGNAEFRINRKEATGRKARGRKPALHPATSPPRVVPVVRTDNTSTISPIAAKAKSAAKPDVTDILAAARSVEEVLSRPVSAPNYEAARNGIRKLIELAQSLMPPVAVPITAPATSNAKLDLGAFGRVLGHA